MISTELAKKLRDAGFPFKQNARGETIDIDGRMYCLPTLSDLIDACAIAIDDMFTMNYYGASGWEVWFGKADGSLETIGRGSSPETAVAKLWLALNPKNV